MNAGGTLLLLIFFIFALGVAWVYTGGPERPIGQFGAFLQPPAPLGTGESYNIPSVDFSSYQQFELGRYIDPNPYTPAATTTKKPTLLDYYFNFRTDKTAIDDSVYMNDVALIATNAKESDPKKEYIVIKTSKRLKNPITISNWTLEGVTSGIKVKVGEAAQLPFLGTVNVDQQITLPAASMMYISTGRAPNGTSFRVNQCTGYFEQFQDFIPNLPKECPDPEEEMLLFPGQTLGNDECINFIKRLPSCTLRVTEIPPLVGSLCQTFILDQLSYNGCITTHRYDAGFYKNEWRVFLNRSQELWKNTHEQIRLLDESGKLVASVTY